LNHNTSEHFIHQPRTNDKYKMQHWKSQHS